MSPGSISVRRGGRAHTSQVVPILEQRHCPFLVHVETLHALYRAGVSSSDTSGRARRPIELRCTERASAIQSS